MRTNTKADDTYRYHITHHSLEFVHVFVSDRQHVDSTYNWVQGLGSAPDVPHAVDASSRKTEGNGVGVTKEPPVSVTVAETGRGWVTGVEGGSGVVCGGGNDAALSLCFNIRVIGQEVTWETLLVGRTLFIEIAPDILPVGSKERYCCIAVFLTLSVTLYVFYVCE